MSQPCVVQEGESPGRGHSKCKGRKERAMVCLEGGDRNRVTSNEVTGIGRSCMPVEDAGISVHLQLEGTGSYPAEE